MMNIILTFFITAIGLKSEIRSMHAYKLIRVLALICVAHTMSFAQVQSWGGNSNGVLGQGTGGGIQPTPQTIADSANFTAISASPGHVLALKADGAVMAWGANGSGQLGDGTTDQRNSPVAVPNLINVKSISANESVSFAILTNGTLMVWGSNFFGAFGNGNSGIPGEITTVPQPVPGMTNVIAISSGFNHYVALKADGTVWSWGLNDRGQVGNGTVSPSNSAIALPTQILTGAVAVAAGRNNGGAVMSDGTLRIWGINDNGQLGNGTSTNTGCSCVPNPTQSSITNVAQVSIGFSHVVALKTDGTVYGWGFNNFGQLGDGTFNSGYSLPNAALISDVVAIDAGTQHTIVRKRDGSVWGYGSNFQGGIGDGTADGDPNCSNCRPTPVQSLTGTGNTLIAAAGFQSYTARPNPVTPTGSNVRLLSQALNMQFFSVLTSGFSSFLQINPASVAGNFTLPSGSILANQPAFEISTTAQFSGSIDVCMSDIRATDEPTFNGLQMLHGEGTTWVNRTLSRDFARREICGRVNSLSPFVIGQGVAPPTSASVTVAGGVFLAKTGRGVSGVIVTLTDSSGQTVVTKTGSFGRYRFDGVRAGDIYTVAVSSKRHQFDESATILNVNEAVNGIDFTAFEFSAVAPLSGSRKE